MRSQDRKPVQGPPHKEANQAVGTVAPSRVVAAHILLMVERGTAHSDDQLHSPRAEALSRQDRDLMTQLVLGTLRWQLYLDDEIAARLSRPDAEMHLSVIVALRLGAYQLLFLDRIPAHAAIGESVELAKIADGAHAAGMVNAVLRRIAREQKPGPRAGPDPAAAHLGWMVARWRDRFGAEATEKLCAYNQRPAPTALRLLHAEAENSLATSGIEIAPGEFLDRARRVISGSPSGSPALAGGRVRVQDEASQLVAELTALPGLLGEPQRVFDACAAPGGKTAILLERLPAAHITAMDLSEARLRRMRQRMPGEARLASVVGDAAMIPPEPAYDAILCDAPCSGTGTLARNPEIRHRLVPESFARLQQRQVAILQACLAALKPGGRLVYATCSLEPEENEHVVEEAIRSRVGYEIIPVAGEIARLEELGVVTGGEFLRSTAVSGNYLRTVPGVAGCDGFFAAVVRRASP